MLKKIFDKIFGTVPVITSEPLNQKHVCRICNSENSNRKKISIDEFYKKYKNKIKPHKTKYTARHCIIKIIRSENKFFNGYAELALYKGRWKWVVDEDRLKLYFRIE